MYDTGDQMNASTTTLRSTLASVIGRHMLVVGLLSIGALLLQQPTPFDPEANAGGSNEPTWTVEIAEQFPACVEQQEGTVAAAVVVVDSAADVSRMSVDRAYGLNTDGERANDVWVVGACQ